MCGEGIADEHSHVVNVAKRNLMCTCRACYLLFTPEGASLGNIRAVPDRYTYDPGFQIDRWQWEQLQIPVGMAFFFHNSSAGKTVAFYPSPGGATESLLSIEVWDQIVAANPDVILVHPCGFDMARTLQEMPLLEHRPGWRDLKAVQRDRIFVADGNQYFNRPGPRVVESLEILAEIFHPELFTSRYEEKGWTRYTAQRS